MSEGCHGNGINGSHTLLSHKIRQAYYQNEDQRIHRMTTYEPGECPVLLQDRYVQDERYFAIEHMDVRREAFRGAHMCLRVLK